MSKPSKKQKRNRTELLLIAVTPDEKKLFQGIARWHHSSFAEFARQLFYRESRVSKVA
jgi:hypothetical protein